MSNTVVVLGGGIGGIAAAHGARKHLDPGDRVVIIDRSEMHSFAPSYPFVLAGTRSPAAIKRPLARLKSKGIDVLRADVEAIDVEAGFVMTSDSKVEYDRLVISLGAETRPDTISGFAEAAHDFFTLEGAVSANKALKSFKGGRVAVVVSRLPYKCPAAPYETAFIADGLIRRSGLKSVSQVDIYTPEPLPMPTTGPAIGHALASMLAAREIGFHPGVELQSIDPDGGEMLFADGDNAPYDLLLGVPVHAPPAAVAQSAIAGPTGYVPVDPKTLATEAEGVYAIGDVASVAISGGKFLPKAGVFAHGQGEVVARRIGTELGGGAATDEFDGSGSCFVELGNGRAAFAAGNFYADGGPSVKMRRDGRHWHWGKLLFEQYWLRRWW